MNGVKGFPLESGLERTLSSPDDDEEEEAFSSAEGAFASSVISDFGS